MQHDDHSKHEPTTGKSFWRSPPGVALIVFLAIAAILLGFEHRVHIFGGVSGTAVFLILWFGLHFLMHRGHGGHGGHGGQGHNSGHGGQGQNFGLGGLGHNSGHGGLGHQSGHDGLGHQSGHDGQGQTAGQGSQGQTAGQGRTTRSEADAEGDKTTKGKDQ